MKKILTLLMVATCIAGGPARAQIPTTDILANITELMNQTQDMTQWAEQLQQMYRQIDEMQKQYEQLEAQAEAISGTRNLGDIFNNPLFRNYLPDDWQNVYDEIKDGGYGSLTGEARLIQNRNRIYDMCATISTAEQRRVCEAQAAKSAQDRAYASTAFEAASGRVGQIESLMESINGTSDAKGIAEVQARIAVEQANIQNEATKLQMFQMIASAEDRALRQQQLEVGAQQWQATGRTEYVPLTFE